MSTQEIHAALERAEKATSWPAYKWETQGVTPQDVVRWLEALLLAMEALEKAERGLYDAKQAWDCSYTIELVEKARKEIAAL